MNIPDPHRVTIEHALRLTELVISQSPLCDEQELADIRTAQVWLQAQQKSCTPVLGRLRHSLQDFRRQLNRR